MAKMGHVWESLPPASAYMPCVLMVVPLQDSGQVKFPLELLQERLMRLDLTDGNSR